MLKWRGLEAELPDVCPDIPLSLFVAEGFLLCHSVTAFTDAPPLLVWFCTEYC